MKIRALPGAQDGGLPSAVNVTNNGPLVATVTPGCGEQFWLNGFGQSCAKCLLYFSAEAGPARARAAAHPAAASAAALVSVVFMVYFLSHEGPFPPGRLPGFISLMKAPPKLDLGQQRMASALDLPLVVI